MEKVSKLIPERIDTTMEKKKREKTKSTLSSMQEVLYSREFKQADRAAGGSVTGKRGGNI